MDDKKTPDIGQKQAVTSHPADSMGPFGNNRAGSFLYKKAERLAVALHLITNAIPQDEAVRIRIRETALGLLPETLELHKGFRSAGSERTNSIGALLLEIVSLLDVANAGGYLSGMNLAIVKNECLRLVRFIRDVEDTSDAEAVLLAEQYFHVPMDVYQGHKLSSSTAGEQGMSLRKPRPSKRQYIQKDNIAGASLQKERSKARLDRQARILALVQEKEKVSVRDVAVAIRDCGEKTLQRELLLLVRQGVLRKEGERRWSTYTLVAP